MKTRKINSIIAKLICLSLLVSMCLLPGVMGGDRASAQSANKPAAKISSDLTAKARGRKSDDIVKVIVQLRAPMSGQLNALLNRNGAHVRATFRNLAAHAVDLPASIIDDVAAFDEVAYVSLNRETRTLGHVSLTTGADAVRNSLGSLTTLDGTGIGIAVVDSGLDTGHVAFGDKNGVSRIVFSKDFTGENRVDDPYGHGTHVASIAAGNGKVSNSSYIGIAPNAKIVNLRVLNSQGTGTVSATLAALDWLLSNRTTYNVRVVNMSLGTPAVDSYKYDPICRAVRKLVDAGVVVAAAAGNNGKNSAGQKVYGQIHCPGNEPSAITVGAANSFGTDSRADDGV